MLSSEFAMSSWRVLGNLHQATSREEIRSQSLDGWNPWQHPWNRCLEPGIVVPDEQDSNRFHHAPTYWVEDQGKKVKFAVVHVDDNAWRFFVPATATETSAFDAR